LQLYSKRLHNHHHQGLFVYLVFGHVEELTKISHLGKAYLDAGKAIHPYHRAHRTLVSKELPVLVPDVAWQRVT
jgi:hypothetical protein